MSEQKGKSMKRKRSWHRRGNGPDRAFAAAVRRLETAIMDRLHDKYCPCGAEGDLEEQ